MLLVLWLACLLAGGWWLAEGIRLRSDLSLFLPGGGSARQQLLLSELQSGAATRLLLLGIRGGDARGRAELSQALLGALRQSGLFQRVENGTPGDMEIDQRLFAYRYLLSGQARLAEDFSVAGLREALEARLKELQSPMPSPFKPLLSRDPTGAYLSMLKRWQPQDQVTRTQGVWSSQQGDWAILLAQTREAGLNIDSQTQTVDLIGKTFDRLDTAGGYGLTVSGPGAFGVLSRQIIERDSRQLSLIASLAIAALLFLAYRHWPYLLYAAFPLLSALLVAALATGWMFEELHGITLAFGITLLGVTLDYPVHLFSHLQDGEKPAHTMGRIWNTLKLGVLTTCIGYLVLVTTDFDGLRQLGLFTLTGLITAALCTRYLLPRLLPEADKPPPPRGVHLLSVLTRRRRWLPVALLISAAGLCVGSLFSQHDLWNDDIAMLSPLSPALLDQDRFLRRQLMAEESNQVILLQGENVEQLLRRCESLRPVIVSAVQERLLGGATLPCDYLPSEQRQRLVASQLPDTVQLAERLQRALEGLPFRQNAFTLFLSDLENSRSLPPLSYPMTQGSPLNTRLASMLRPLKDGREDGWLALVPLRQVTDPSRLSARMDGAIPGLRYLDLRQETSQMIGGFRQEILQRMSLGLLVMLAVLWLGLRSLAGAMGTLLPIALAMLLTVTLLNLWGETLNLFHLISLMLVLGIGIDYSLFFFREADDGQACQATLHALSVCALSTVSVFMVLAWSGIPVLHAIGQTVAIGVSMSYLCTYAFWQMPWIRTGGAR